MRSEHVVKLFRNSMFSCKEIPILGPETRPESIKTELQQTSGKQSPSGTVLFRRCSILGGFWRPKPSPESSKKSNFLLLFSDLTCGHAASLYPSASDLHFVRFHNHFWVRFASISELLFASDFRRTHVANPSELPQTIQPLLRNRTLKNSL